MLKPIKRGRVRAGEGRFVIIASRYNARYVDAMLRAAKAELKRARAADVQVIRVPGAFEIPVVAAHLAASCHAPVFDSFSEGGPVLRSAFDEGGSRPAHPSSIALAKEDHASRITRHASLSAIICLGVILRGETTHAAHIGEAVTRALMEIQLRHQVPVIHEVLLLENEAQARARCLGRTHNRGAEAAQTALVMAGLITRLRM